jgi:tRNA uridine 5-carboxymethylaminomethyl modification enzyme
LEILKRPEITYDDLEKIDKRQIILPEEVKEQVEINVKYAGYIEKSIKEAEKMKKEHNIKIPNDIDYDKVHNLALEARAKLNKIRPLTISQATRISGVNPADIQMLLLYLKTYET